jgi:hypothetical protein
MTAINHYHKCVRKITSAFASIFNNIVLIRDNNQRIVVPIEYGDKEKFVKRLQGDPELDKKVQVLLPRISYEMVGFNYDKDRKLNTNNKNFSSNPDNADKAFMQYNPVPYDFNFGLTIYTRNVEDGNQIIEQILPYFTPDYSLRVTLVPEMGITKVIPIVLNDVRLIIESDGMFNSEVRTVIWTLSFTAKGFIFGAVKDVPIIKEVNENFLFGIGGSFDSGIGTSCNPNGSKSFNVDPDGYGDYINGEWVYQGQKYDLAYATGKVGDWNANSNTVYITDIMGNFKLNQPIIGTDSLSIHVPISATSNDMIAFTKTITVSPNTANANSYWQPELSITEYVT